MRRVTCAGGWICSLAELCEVRNFRDKAVESLTKIPNNFNRLSKMIDLMPNVTFFVQLGIFLVTLFALHLLIFRPILRIIVRREELTAGFRKETDTLNDKTEALLLDCENKMKSAREEGLALKGESTHEGEQEARSILNQARVDTEGTIEQHRQALQAEAKAARLNLRKHSRDLSGEMAEKLLGRKVSA